MHSFFPLVYNGPTYIITPVECESEGGKGKISNIIFSSCFWTKGSSLLKRLFQPLHLCVSLLLLLNKKVVTSSFFDMCLAFGVEVENVKDIQSKKYLQKFTKKEFFQRIH